MQLKRWESPRRRGRNDKGQGGSARQRQIKKQNKLWVKRLKETQSPETNKGKDDAPSLLFWLDSLFRNHHEQIRSPLPRGRMVTASGL